MRNSTSTCSFVAMALAAILAGPSTFAEQAAPAPAAQAPRPASPAGKVDGQMHDASHMNPVKYSAVAVDTTATPAQTVPVTLTVERWSTDAERDRLLTVLQEKGSDALLDVLKALPSVGRISSTRSVGFEIHFARLERHADGSSRVVLATDRWMNFPEVRAGGRSMNYPFTIVELSVGPKGEGEGKMTYATKISWDREKDVLTLENFANQPVLLQGVRRME